MRYLPKPVPKHLCPKDAATHVSHVLHHDLLELPELLLEVAAAGRGLDACSPLPECQAVADLDRRVGQPCRDALHGLDGWVSQSEWAATSITPGAQCRAEGLPMSTGQSAENIKLPPTWAPMPRA